MTSTFTVTEFLNLVIAFMDATGLMVIITVLLAGYLSIALLKYLLGKD